MNCRYQGRADQCFPVKQTAADFNGDMTARTPQLQIQNPQVYSLLDGVQPYNNEFVADFNKIHNANKHDHLVEQVRQSVKAVEIRPVAGGKSHSCSLIWRC